MKMKNFLKEKEGKKSTKKRAQEEGSQLFSFPLFFYLQCYSATLLKKSAAEEEKNIKSSFIIDWAKR